MISTLFTKLFRRNPVMHPEKPQEGRLTRLPAYYRGLPSDHLWTTQELSEVLCEPGLQNREQSGCLDLPPYQTIGDGPSLRRYYKKSDVELFLSTYENSLREPTMLELGCLYKRLRKLYKWAEHLDSIQLRAIQKVIFATMSTTPNQRTFTSQRLLMTAVLADRDLWKNDAGWLSFRFIAGEVLTTYRVDRFVMTPALVTWFRDKGLARVQPADKLPDFKLRLRIRFTK